MAKEKKEKVVVRKCHHCKKPLAEGKDFCLYCGHTYTEEDPFAAQKKAKRIAILIKSLIKAAIVLGILLAVAVAALLLWKAINKSDFLKVIEFIKDEGEFIEGTPLPEDEESVEGEEGESSEEESSEEESSEESSVDSESSEDEENTEDESTEEELPPRRVTLPDNYNRYVYKLSEGYYLCCLEDATNVIYLIYEIEAEGLYNRTVIELNEETPKEGLWEYRMRYTGDNVVDSRYDFDYTYYGSFDPSTFTLNDDVGKWGVQIVTQIKEEVEEELPEDEEELPEDEEDESSSSEDEEESSSDAEEDDGIEEEPMISPEQARENAAVASVTIEVRRLVYYLAKCIETENIGANFDGLGFTKFYSYLESLDPMNNPFKDLKK